ncbi:MAG: hypothetical protein IIX05_01150, partial [Selenomonadaceae bacterium]|nr:hypothetical protein [Selenomonadaceae bacterium]
CLNRYAHSYQLYSAVRYQGNQSDFTKKLKRGSREADETCYCRPLYKLKSHGKNEVQENILKL